MSILQRALAAYTEADPKFSSEIVRWGTRACADLAVTARDHHDAGAEAQARAALARFRAADVALASTLQEYRDDGRHDAHRAVLDAESERCIDGAEQGPLGEAAETACARAGFAYDATYAPASSSLRACCGADNGVMLPWRCGAPTPRSWQCAPYPCGMPPRAAPPPPASLSRNRPCRPGAPRCCPREQEVLGHLVAGRFTRRNLDRVVDRREDGLRARLPPAPQDRHHQPRRRGRLGRAQRRRRRRVKSADGFPQHSTASVHRPAPNSRDDPEGRVSLVQVPECVRYRSGSASKASRHPGLQK